VRCGLVSAIEHFKGYRLIRMREQQKKLTEKTDTLPLRSPGISDEESGIKRDAFASVCLVTTFCSIAPFDAVLLSEVGTCPALVTKF
jgi:hypothetical protein